MTCLTAFDVTFIYSNSLYIIYIVMIVRLYTSMQFIVKVRTLKPNN